MLFVPPKLARYSVIYMRPVFENTYSSCAFLKAATLKQPQSSVRGLVSALIDTLKQNGFMCVVSINSI